MSAQDFWTSLSLVPPTHPAQEKETQAPHTSERNSGEGPRTHWESPSTCQGARRGSVGQASHLQLQEVVWLQGRGAGWAGPVGLLEALQHLEKLGQWVLSGWRQTQDEGRAGRASPAGPRPEGLRGPGRGALAQHPRRGLRPPHECRQEGPTFARACKHRVCLSAGTRLLVLLPVRRTEQGLLLPLQGRLGDSCGPELEGAPGAKRLTQSVGPCLSPSHLSSLFQPPSLPHPTPTPNHHHQLWVSGRHFGNQA